MRQAIDVLRSERRARIFFLALTQSSLGTGAAFVALTLLAYERLESGWSIALVLMADVLPAMLLGPIFGAAADRWSRRGCAVTADVLRAAAFLGIALVDSFTATLFFALVAGIGTGLFTPAALASLPSLVDEQRLPAATSLYGAVIDIGFTAGPGIAAGVLVIGGPEAIMTANGVSFAISALLLAALRFGEPPERDSDEPRTSLVRDAREGIAAMAQIAGLPTVLFAATGALFLGALFNVAELPFVTKELDSGSSGYAVLVAMHGVGFIAGSLSGSQGGELQILRRHFLYALALMGAALTATGVAPNYAIAIGAIALGGFANGSLLIHERLIIQASVPDRLSARIYGARDALTAWGFALAFVSAGGLISVLDLRPLIVGAGLLGLAVWLVASLALRRSDPGLSTTLGAPSEPRNIPAPPLGRSGPYSAMKRSGGLDDRPELLHGSDFWSALLDDLDQGRSHGGVKLTSGVGRDLG